MGTPCASAVTEPRKPLAMLAAFSPASKVEPTAPAMLDPETEGLYLRLPPWDATASMKKALKVFFACS
jgi:hypothetical protein